MDFSAETRDLRIYEPADIWATPIGTRDKHARGLPRLFLFLSNIPLGGGGVKQIILSLPARLGKPSHRLRFNIVKLFFYIPLPFFLFSFHLLRLFFFPFFFAPVELVVIKWQRIPMWQSGAVRWRMKQSYFLIKTLMDCTQRGRLLGLLMRGRYDHPISSCERNGSRSGAVIVSAPLLQRTFSGGQTLRRQINTAKPTRLGMECSTVVQKNVVNGMQSGLCIFLFYSCNQSWW